jgi:response regulator RpfG family c-di-GMP phosphodiesterase
MDAMNLTNEQKAVLLEAVSDYIYIYENHSKLVERVKAAKEVVAIVQEVFPANDNVASLKTELAAALGDIIAYRRMRYADSAPEVARYRELTGHDYDDE